MRLGGGRATDMMSEIHDVVSHKSTDSMVLQVSKYSEETIALLNTFLY